MRLTGSLVYAFVMACIMVGTAKFLYFLASSSYWWALTFMIVFSASFLFVAVDEV